MTFGKWTFVTKGAGATRITPPLRSGTYKAAAAKPGYASATLRFKVT